VLAPLPFTALFLTVIPAKAGIHGQYEAWIPAFAGMTVRKDDASGPDVNERRYKTLAMA
jgi:hypothetical protein